MYATDQILKQLHQNALQFSRYENSVLVFYHTPSRHSPCSWSEVYFSKQQFMHLMGIKAPRITAEEFYERCIRKTVTAADCIPRHSYSNRNAKIMLFPELFDFSRAKLYEFAEKDLSTELNDFTLATGNSKGTVGYDTRLMYQRRPFPVTLLSNPITYYCSRPEKILAVVQRLDGDERVLYEAKKGLYESFLKG